MNLRNPYRELEKKLGYKFRRRRRLETALTHPSYRYENESIEEDNQRLEFLGDAALGLAAAAHLYEHFPDFEEGDLTQFRSSITNSKMLAQAAMPRVVMVVYWRVFIAAAPWRWAGGKSDR